MDAATKLRRQRHPDAPFRRRIQRTAAQLEALSDTRLIELCVECDEEAWREFRRRYEPALREQCLLIASHALKRLLDSDAVDDMMGDFYLRIVEANMHKLHFWLGSDRQASVSTWLGSIAYTIAKNYARGLKREHEAQAMFATFMREGMSGLRRAAVWGATQDRAMDDTPPPKKRGAKRPERIPENLYDDEEEDLLLRAAA